MRASNPGGSRGAHARPSDRAAVEAYYRKILPFYELEAARRPDLAFWRRTARRERPRLALELGSGFGRVTAAIVPFAGRVVGMDLVLPMLQTAARRAIGAAFAAADMRRIPFRECFDLVVAPSDPISHCLHRSDREGVLRQIARATRAGGLFVLDGLFRPDRIPAQRVRRIPLLGGSLTVRERWSPLARARFWSVEYCYRLRRKTVVRTEEATFLARSWDRDELRDALADAGFDLESLAGGFDGRPVDRESRRLVALARRR